MSQSLSTQYPSHLAQLIKARLRGLEIPVPPDKVLLRLLETLYFASLKTDEQRPCRCSINYADPQDHVADPSSNRHASLEAIRFRHRIPLDVCSLTKLAEAADPSVSSLAVYHDDAGGLFVWGMFDDELHHSDFANGNSRKPRPGSFQAAIMGIGNISVFKNHTMLGSLEQNNLIASYHDVLWQGPVYRRLKANLKLTLAGEKGNRRDLKWNDVVDVYDELLVRWQNAICRILLHIQKYGHGGGLLIVPRCPADDVHVKYQLRYDRLPRALFGLAKHQLLKRKSTDTIAEHCRTPMDLIPCDMHYDALEYENKTHDHKNEALGCGRFIASLSRVDGFVLLDKSLVVHGFGVEARADSEKTEIYTAADARGTPSRLRQANISQFGTRHRAMMRYCQLHKDALGFVISQDGDIRATMKVKDRLVLWENINVQIGLRHENQKAAFGDSAPVNSFFKMWGQSLSKLA